MRPECQDFNILSVNDRSRFAGMEKSYCDYYGAGSASPDWKGPGWYRFTSPAGNKLAQSPTGYGKCGAHWTGWSNATLPANAGDSVNIKICFDADVGNAIDCYESNQGKVTNCGSFFVYYLVNVPRCNLRYCGSY